MPRLIALEKLARPQAPNPGVDALDLRLQLRDEMDRLALFLEQVKVQAERVRHVADALGNEFFLTSLAAPQDVRSPRRNGRRSPE
jgi:hypothetical protein